MEMQAAKSLMIFRVNDDVACVSGTCIHVMVMLMQRVSCMHICTKVMLIKSLLECY